MINNLKKKTLVNKLICVIPEIGDKNLSAYVAGDLSEDERQLFEEHLPFCRKCQEELKHIHWILEQFKARKEIFADSDTDINTVLPVTLIHDWNDKNLTPYYHKKPTTEELAAATDSVLSVAFPITVEYENGQVVGEFWNRMEQLFFRLKQCPGSRQYLLVFHGQHLPHRTQKFKLQGEETWLGTFSDFVASETTQGIVQAIQQFQLIVNVEE